MNPGAHFALDASAVLALLQNEKGHDKVRQVLGNAWMHTVNLAEVIGKLTRSGIPKHIATMAVRDLQLEVDEEFGVDQAEACGILLAETRTIGLSLGDCVCLTAAAWRRSEAVTAERLWQKLEGRTIGPAPLRVVIIR